MEICFQRGIKAQVEIFDDDVTNYLMMCGGFGSGKTSLLFYKGLKLSLMNQHKPGGLLVPTFAEFKRDFLPMALEVMTREIPGATYKSSGQFGAHFTFPWTRAPLYVFTAERPIKGPNLGYLLINEFSMIRWVRIWQFLSRRRLPGCIAPQTIFAGTPEDEHDWLDKFMAKHQATGRLKVKYATSFDNKFNAEGYAEDLLENLSEDEANVYVYGRPGRIGQDYFFHGYKPAFNNYAVKYDPEEKVHVSVDFNVGKMSAGLAHVYGEGKDKQIGYFGEIRPKNGDADTEELGRAIMARVGKDNVLITCDASGKARKTTGLSDVKVLAGMGFKVRYSTSNPRIRRSQIIVNSLFKRRRIFINPDACPLLAKDLLKVKQLADFEQDKSKPELTHFSDGLRYLVFHEFPDFLERDEDKRRAKVTILGARDDRDE